MVVVTYSASLSLQTQSSSHSHHLSHYTATCKPSPPSLLYLRQLYRNHTRSTANYSNGVLSVRSYMEDRNSITGFARKVLGSLPVFGLIARIMNDEGGLGGDTIDFAEFRRRVGNKCSVSDSRAFYQFKDRRGRAGDPLYVLICCWLAAVGAGLLKSEEILEGVARLRISNDVEFEEETFISMMKEGIDKREKLNIPPPTVPMEARVEKALDAVYVCCFGTDPIEEEDERLLCIMLKAIFPSVGQPEINRIVRQKAMGVADGSDDNVFPEPKPLSKEAVDLQMKDLQFLRQNSDT